MNHAQGHPPFCAPEIFAHFPPRDEKIAGDKAAQARLWPPVAACFATKATGFRTGPRDDGHFATTIRPTSVPVRVVTW